MASITKDTCVKLKGLKIQAHIGCSEEEREERQNLEIDLVLLVPSAGVAASSLNLDDTVSYLTVRNLVTKLVISRSWVLVEELAASVMQMLFMEFPQLEQIDIEVKKFVFADCAWAGVSMRGIQT